jgi:hypothetical protein
MFLAVTALTPATLAGALLAALLAGAAFLTDGARR